MRRLFSPFFYFQQYVNLIFKWNGLKLKTFKNEDFIIEYWASDSNKPPLVLLPAFAAESKFTWYKQIRRFSKHYRVITPNLIYFGKSSMHKKSYSMQDQVDGVMALINHLKLVKINIGGSSFGGAIAAEIGLQYPELIRKMILINGPIKYDLASEVTTLLKENNMSSKSELLVPEDHKNLFSLFKISYHRVPPVPSFVFKSIHRNLYIKGATDKRKLVDASDAELEKLRDREYKFKFPVLLIWGEKDRLSPLAIGEKLKEHIGDSAELSIIPKTAHMPNFEKPRKYNKIFLEFLLR